MFVRQNLLFRPVSENVSFSITKDVKRRPLLNFLPTKLRRKLEGSYFVSVPSPLSTRPSQYKNINEKWASVNFRSPSLHEHSFLPRLSGSVLGLCI